MMKEAKLEGEVQVFLATNRNDVPPDTLLTWEDMPPWYQQLTKNPYIKTGYRPISNHCWNSLKSMVIPHNELGNAWTHLIGALFLGFLLIQLLQSSPGNQTIAFLVLELGACVLCLVCSFVFHLMISHSNGVANRCHACDHHGISLAVCCSVVATGFYAFDSRWFKIYISFILIFTLGTLFASSSQYGHVLKTVLYVLLGSCILIPYIYVSQASERRIWRDVGLSALYFVVGVVIFIFRIPERWYSGFDIVGQSHQIWHVCVVMGMYHHHLSLLQMHNSLYK